METLATPVKSGTASRRAFTVCYPDSSLSAPLALLGGPAIVTIPQPHYRWPLIEADDEAAVLGQLRSGELSLHGSGGVVERFEKDFAKYHGVPWAISTNSGTAALHAAFFALDLERGDEVLAPAYTHLSTVLPMLHCNLIPILCDVDRLTGNLDIADARLRVSKRTRAIVVTHQYGHLCDMPQVLNFAREHQLRVIEDCSHAHGATLDGQRAGTFGDAGCFSLQAHKAVPAGEGGILITSNPRVLERAALLGHFRQPTAVTSDKYAPFVGTGYGLKNRLHPLGAALALSQFRKLSARVEQRRKNLEYFTERLCRVPGIRALPTASGIDRGGYFRFVVRYDGEALGGLPLHRYVEALLAEGVAEVLPGSLAKPLHLYPIFQTLEDRMYRSGWPRQGPHTDMSLVYGPGDFPGAEHFSSTTLQFPAFTEPSTDIIDAYCAAMTKVARSAALLTHTA